MSVPSSIPPNLEPTVLAMAGEGMSLRRIAALLLSEHSVKTSANGVLRLLNRIKEERRPMAQAVVQEKLSKTLTTDLDEVSGILKRARRMERKAAKAGEIDTALRAQDRQLKALAQRFELSGAGGGGKDDFEDLVLEAQRIRDARRAK